MIRKNRILAFFLTVFITLPIFTVNTGAENNSRTESNHIFIDYIAEKIWIVPSEHETFAEVISDGNNVITDAGMSEMIASMAKSPISTDRGKPQYMYALKAVSPAQLDFLKSKPDKYINVLANEKWYPIYGGGIDITKAIPNQAAKNEKNAHCIAIRKADDIFNNLNGFESRIAFIISPRYNKFNKALEYDAVNEKIVLAQSFQNDQIDAVYQFDYFLPNNVKMTKNGNQKGLFNIDVPANHFSFGCTVNISTAPQNIDGTFFARSKSVKFKVPKQPNPPAVQFDKADKKITGMKTKGLEYSFDTVKWELYSGTSSVNFTKLADLEAVFNGIQDSEKHETENNEYAYKIYIRVAPIEKKAPASNYTTIEIPETIFFPESSS